ncbi:hypothetical protein HDV04_006172, partial [Boothiomyces sp. JEL0838]
SELEVEIPESELAVEIPSSPEYWNTIDDEIIVIQSSDDENESNCLICFEDLPGYSCPKHSLCKGCFSQYISTELDKPLALLANSKGKIKCPKPDCNSYYSSKQITDGGMIDKYIQIVYKLGEMEGVNSAPTLQIDSLRTRLEEALNLTCPWCRAVFVDYDGCDAVICSKCNKYFCGLCLVGCANNSQAHQHAAACSGNGSYHSHQNTKKQKHLLHKQTKINRLLECLTGEEKNWVKRNFMKTFKKEKIKVLL